MATEILVRIGSGNGLLPDGIKPLPKAKLTDHQKGVIAFTYEQFISQDVFMSLTHGTQVTPYADIYLGQHWFRLWLFANVDLPRVGPSDIHLRTILQEIPQSPITMIILKMTCLQIFFQISEAPMGVKLTGA